MQLSNLPPYSDYKLRALVVDSHRSVSQLVSMLLGREGFRVFGESPDGVEGLRCYRKYKPDLIISEVELPELGGIEMLHTMRAEKPDIKILVYTGSTNEELIQAALEMKPQGFVHKSESLEVFSNALTMVAQGLGCFSPFAIGRIRRGESNLNGTTNLTITERTLLQMIAEGASSKQVASRLSLSIKTIERQRKNLMQKLGASSIASLTVYAVKLGMIPLWIATFVATDPSDWPSLDSLVEFTSSL